MRSSHHSGYPGVLPRIQVCKLGCCVHYYFMPMIHMRRRHVRHSVHFEPSFTYAVEKGTGIACFVFPGVL